MQIEQLEIGKEQRSMKKISFEGIGEVAATFECGDGALDGQVVKITGDGTVGACGAGERFCGVALHTGDGRASVQLSGLATVRISGEVDAGWVKLSADGAGGVKKDESAGDEFLVVSAGSAGAVIRL